MNKIKPTRTVRHPRRALLLPLLAVLALLSIEPAAANSHPAIWVGSPVNSTWGVPGDASTTPAGGHHRFAKASPQNDWAVDLSSIDNGDRAAYLYVAPSNSAYNNRVTTVISQIIDDNACRYGGGGDLITVTIRLDGTVVGQATYGHLDRNPNLRVGQSVARWGTWLGNVANLSGSATGGSNCWTGRHVHAELRASTDYSCWNRGYGTGQRLYRSNFIGFVTGPSLARTAQPCP
jgi:hypothetical protein